LYHSDKNIEKIFIFLLIFFKKLGFRIISNIALGGFLRYIYRHETDN
jgi:hypothetical protein